MSHDRTGQTRHQWYQWIKMSANTQYSFLSCHKQGSHSKDRSKFHAFQDHKSHKIMTYSSIIYSLLTRIWQQKTIDINLPVPIIDTKQLHTNYFRKKITPSMASFFGTTLYKILWLLQHLQTFQGVKNQKVNFRTFRDMCKPCIIERHVFLPTVGSRAFPTAGAKVWNSLPDDVTSAPSLSTFRRHLKTLFRCCYNPVWYCSYLLCGPRGGIAA